MNVGDIGSSRIPSPLLSRHPQGPPRQQETPVAAGTAPESPGVVTPEEKAFFASAFPSAAEEIQSYQAYSEKGMRPASRTGTLVDRRA